MGRILRALGLFLLLGTGMAVAQPRVAIIIDDMGNNRELGNRALSLPGRLTYAFLPHTRYARSLAERCHRLRKEVLLHLPMQPRDPEIHDPGMLRVDMNKRRFRRTLLADIVAVPHISGVNNHRGSLLTTDRRAMQWLMGTLRTFGLFFIDSRTIDDSVAQKVAARNGLATAGRNIFLDHVIDRRSIRRQYRKLLRLARRHGQAIAIGHPHPETLEVLAQELPHLRKEGIRLVPVSHLTRQQPRRRLWHASSYPSPKVAKNLKPSPSSTCCGAAE